MQEPLKPINTPDALFHDGNPTSGALGTVVGADWLNNVSPPSSPIRKNC